MVLVTASFTQDAVFFSGEKLSCQFRFSNPITQSFDALSLSRNTSPIHNRHMELERSSLSDTNSARSFAPEEGNSICSSRSSLDSYNTNSTVSAKHSRNSMFPADICKAKSSEIPSSHRGSRVVTPGGTKPDAASRVNQPSHQTSLSQPNIKISTTINTGQNPARQFRQSTFSSWLSKFAGGLPEKTGKIPVSPVITPNSQEELNWGYVQLAGHFVVDATMVHSSPFEPLKSKCMYRAATGLGNGGGTLGLSANPYVSNIGYGNGVSNLSGMTEFKRQDNKMFPVFSSPPSVLFCNLKLNPGESKIFDYEIILPEGLPSTYRGKCIKIFYYLIIGTQKGEITQEPSVVQLPFRLFAKVNDYGIIPKYDLMEPILIHKDNSIIRSPTDALRREPISSKAFSTADEFLSKALEMLSLSSAEADEGDDEDDGSLPYSNGASLKNSISICLKSVYGITRKTKPVSYTFNKGDTVIGRMCLRRSFFRIGESIHILIHFLPSPIKCYQISVTLESYEQVVPEFACQSAVRTDQLTRQILTQYHTLSTNADRSSFDLAIPNHCTPGFATSAVSLQYRLRLEFLVAERTLQNVASGPIDRHHTHNRAQLPIGVEPEKLVCLAPISLLPTYPAYAKTYKSFHSYNMS